VWATTDRLQSGNQPYLFQADEVDCTKNNGPIDYEEIEVDCYTSCNFFLRQFSNIKDAASRSKVPHQQIKECCAKNQETTNVSSNAVFGLIFRYVLDSFTIAERSISPSSISNSEYEDRISLSIPNNSRRQVEDCVIKALKNLKQGRPKGDNSVFTASNAVNCMGADGAFMRRFNDLYHVAITLKLDTANLYKALKTKNTLVGGLSWSYYQGDDDPLGPGVGKVLLLYLVSFFSPF
jgi:hypothetical protein